MKPTSLLILSLVAFPSGMIASACCGVAKLPVVFGGQTNLIVWDADQHIEHFVRSANFLSEGPDLGFIAPTPSAPAISKASPEAFRRLASLEPAPPQAMEFMPTASKADEGALRSVDVIQVVDVAGYRATTLKANDAGALADWMKANGYVTSPSIEAWTRFYIRKGWYLTAFRVNSKNGYGTTGTVRMSFKTARPFNPFYVPKDNESPGGTTLKLYFVANRKFRPTIGENGGWVRPTWQAKLPSTMGFELAEDLELLPEAIPTHAEVTVYDDPNFTKGATNDLFFHQESYLPPLPACLSVGAIATVSVYAIRRKILRLAAK